MTTERSVLETLADLVRINSVNPNYDDGVPEAAISDYVENYFGNHGVKTWRQPVYPDRENVIARLPGRDPNRRVIFEAHMDTVSVAGMTFTPATQWTDLGASGSLVASYHYGPLEGDSDSATVTVHYLGEGEGTVAEAQERWISRFSMPDGRDPHTATVQYTKIIDSMNVHVLNLMGNYHVPPDGATVKEMYRLVGVVVEAPEGMVLLKLMGPEYTGRIMIEAFITMVFQIKRTAQEGSRKDGRKVRI